jgi:hypothetical protein
MIAAAVFGVASAGVLAAFTLACSIDRYRGADSETLAALAVAEDRLTADDAPLWAEVLGVVLAPALVLRGGCHVWAALLAGVDPAVDRNDVTLQNVVLAVRDESATADLAGRLLAASIGITAWLAVLPVASGNGIVRAYLALNCTVLAADPLGVVARRHPSRPMTDATKDTEVNS